MPSKPNNAINPLPESESSCESKLNADTPKDTQIEAILSQLENGHDQVSSLIFSGPSFIPGVAELSADATHSVTSSVLDVSTVLAVSTTPVNPGAVSLVPEHIVQTNGSEPSTLPEPVSSEIPEKQEKPETPETPVTSDVKTKGETIILEPREAFCKNIQEGNLEAITTQLKVGIDLLLDANGYLIEMPARETKACAPFTYEYMDTPITYVLNPELKITAELRLSILQLLTQYKLNLNQANSEGETPGTLALRLKDQKIIDFLISQIPNDLAIRLERAAEKEKKQDSELTNTEGESPDPYAANNPIVLAKLAGVISRTVDIMLKDIESAKNIFNQKNCMPQILTSYKFKIPGYYNLRFMGGEKIIGIKIIAGYDKNDIKYHIDDDRNYFRELSFLRIFDPKDHRNIIIQLALQNGTKEILTVQTKEDAVILQSLLDEYSIYEEPFIATEPAYTPKQWDFIAAKPYKEDGTESFYTDVLHPRILNDFQRYSDLRKNSDAIVIEIGAGLCDLAIKIFNKFANTNSELHVIGTELVAKNVANAKEKLLKLTQEGNNTIDFFVANSVNLLDTLEKLGVLEQIKKIQSDYFSKHNREIPIYIASSGALNRLVLNDVFQSVRVMQNLYRLQPGSMYVAGITETLLNQHILKNVGFNTLSRLRDDEEGGGHNFRLKVVPPESMAAYFNRKLASKPSSLDLSLNPDPLAIISRIDEKLLLKVTRLDISHAYFRNPQELKSFFMFAIKACPNLKEIVYDYHFAADGDQLNAVKKDLLPENPKSTLGKTLSEIVSEMIGNILNDILKVTVMSTDQEQELAYTKRCIARALQPTPLFMKFAQSASQSKVRLNKDIPSIPDTNKDRDSKDRDRDSDKPHMHA